MIKLKSLLEFKGKTLHVYDFDDTLATSEALIYVHKRDGTKLTLTPEEFAVYDEQAGDKIDFSDFSRILRNAKPINRNIKLINNSLKNPNVKTTILTARAIAFPIRHFFKTTFGVEPYVIAVGSSDPMKKANWIEAHIKKGYRNIFFTDDSLKNIAAVDKLKNKYPNVNLVTQIA
jgi:hypothetical protein